MIEIKMRYGRRAARPSFGLESTKPSCSTSTACSRPRRRCTRAAGSRRSTMCSPSGALRAGTPQAPFDAEHDYLAHVDGKPREDGVRDFLRSVASPSRGRPESRPGVVGPAIGDAQAGARRARAARRRRRGVPRLGPLGRELRDAGMRTAVVSSSANADAVLRAAGIDDLFELDRRRRRRRRGSACAASPRRTASWRRPAARRRAGRAVVVEDALAGVAAGRAGGFGLVIGVARGAEPGGAARGRRRRRRRRPRGDGGDDRPATLQLLARRRRRRRLADRRAAVRPRARWPRSSRCSPSATATSACAARPRRACRRTTRA